uniref:molybdate ABC transporter permease subunit n=1 Tax=Ningiella ruwaisensis TaxID=2364274 RepID=UPI00109FA638
MSLQDWQAIRLTLSLAFYTVIILLVIGLPLAWIIANYQGALRPVIETIIALPLVLPPTVLGFYLITAFSPDTWLGQLWIEIVGGQFVFSFTGILVGSIIYSLPFVMQPLIAAFSSISKGPQLSAITLGMPFYYRFWYVVLPMAKPSIITASTLGFAHTLGEFGLLLMIGGNIPGSTQVVSIALFNYVETLEYDAAHRLALLLMMFSFISLFLLYKFNRPKYLLTDE